MINYAIGILILAFTFYVGYRIGKHIGMMMAIEFFMRGRKREEEDGII